MILLHNINTSSGKKTQRERTGAKLALLSVSNGTPVSMEERQCILSPDLLFWAYAV
jgi:hypothetical protein